MSTQALHSAPRGLPRIRRAERIPSDPARWVAIALLLAVVIAEAAFIALAAPSLADIGSLYAVTT